MLALSSVSTLPQRLAAVASEVQWFNLGRVVGFCQRRARKLPLQQFLQVLCLAALQSVVSLRLWAACCGLCVAAAVLFTAGPASSPPGESPTGSGITSSPEADRTAGKLRLYVGGKLAGQGDIKPGSLANINDFVVGRGLVGAIDFLHLARGTLADAKTTIEELSEWQFNGLHLRDFCGNKPVGKRDAGALEATCR